jgi:hypothetical protein
MGFHSRHQEIEIVEKRYYMVVIFVGANEKVPSEYRTILEKMDNDSTNKKENVIVGSLFFFFSY